MPRVREAGRRTRRVYLRLNECQYAGLRQAGVLAGRCAADQALLFVQQGLERRRVIDDTFARWWDVECLRLAQEEMKS